MANAEKYISLKITQAVSAGQLGSILDLGAEKLPEKKWEKLDKRLKASENWTVDSSIVRRCSGTSISAYAEWCGIVAVNLKGTVHRFRILAVYYSEEIRSFAIPVDCLKTDESIKELPGIKFSPAEMRLLLDMADELRNTRSDREITITVKHPVKKTLRSNIKHYRKFDETLPERLLKLLSANLLVLHMVIAAFDMQIRTLKTMKHAPFPIYNFTPSCKDLQAPDRIISIFAALNFTTESDSSEPILIFPKDEKDTKDWYAYVDRMVVLRMSGTSPLRPIIKDLTVRDQTLRSGGLTPPLLPSVPIVISKKFIHHPAAFDVFLAQDEADLTPEDKDVLRNAMAWALSRCKSDVMLRQLDERMKSKNGYRLDPRRVWRDILAEHFFGSISVQEDFHDQASKLMMEEDKAMEEARQERNASIQRAMDLLRTPERYKRQIIDRPKSVEAAREALSTEALAFRFTPTKGEDAGTKLLAFSKDSLIRFLKQTAAAEEIYDAFLDTCDKEGILDNRKRSVKLGEGTFSAITFRIDF